MPEATETPEDFISPEEETEVADETITQGTQKAKYAAGLVASLGTLATAVTFSLVADETIAVPLAGAVNAALAYLGAYLGTTEGVTYEEG